MSLQLPPRRPPRRLIRSALPWTLVILATGCGSAPVTTPSGTTGPVRQADLVAEAVQRLDFSTGQVPPLARLLRRFRRPADAETALRTALEIDPAEPQAHRELGSLLASLGRRQEAVNSFRQALVVEPADGAAHARLAVQLYYLGYAEDAAEHLASARRLGARVPPVRRLAGGPSQ